MLKGRNRVPDLSKGLAVIGSAFSKYLGTKVSTEKRINWLGIQISDNAHPAILWLYDFNTKIPVLRKARNLKVKVAPSGIYPS